MTSTLARIEADDVSERALLLLAADTAAEVPAQFDVGSKYFVSLLAFDARHAAVADIAHVARVLLDAGCVYFCCWGPGCERVHDIIDEECVGDGSSVNDNSTIMTTWHNDESLEEATWFAVNAAFPDDQFSDSCKAVVAICIENPDWKSALEAALADPRSLAARVVAEDGPLPNKSLERTRD